MTIRSCLLAASLAASSAFSATAGGVAITFDDGYESLVELVLPLMREKHIVGTAFIATGFLDRPGRIAIEQLDEFIDAGWELGAHSIMHGDMALMSPQEQLANLIEPLAELLTVTGYDVISFASPFGSYTEELLRQAEQFYKIHMNAWSPEEGINRTESAPPIDIHRWTIRNTDTAEGVCSRITNLAENEVFVIAFHDVTVGPPPNEYDISIDTLEAILDCMIVNDVYHFRARDIIGE